MDDRRRQKIITSFGKRLREVREKKGISIRGLADLADIDYSNLNNIENGKVEIGLITLHIIADALEIEPAELLKK